MVLLASKTVGMKRKRYCDTCLKDPDVRRFLRNLYQRRYQQKRRGTEQDSLTIDEDDI